MKHKSNRHENYEILNLLGYGLAKFDEDFIQEFGFTTKSSFFNYFVTIGIAETGNIVKNRMDLFDPFFPNNGRKGWWQKGNVYIHRKHWIDSHFGLEDVKGYSNIVKLFLKENYKLSEIYVDVKPIVKSRFKRLQETGLEAELYFKNNFRQIPIFDKGDLEDARLFGDGYDFQIDLEEKTFLVEVKGIRANKGKFRLTENEYNKALEYKNDYIVTIVLNLNDLPTFLTIENPIKNLSFKKEKRNSKPTIEYHLVTDIC